MLDLCKLIFGMVTDLLRSRVALEAAILVLRQQINVLRRASRALPWFESYVGRHRSSQMPLRNACLVTFNEGTVMIGFMESVV
jgi:hypothetical protein